MRKYFLFISLFFISCFNKSGNDFNPVEMLPGNWLVLYPQHILKTRAQREIYTEKQDSIISLMGLKLISFKNDGTFLQADSLFGGHGKWVSADTSSLEISYGGTGFESFKGKVAGIMNDTLLISEIVSLDNEQVNLIWHLKKVLSGNEAAILFKEEYNSWRKKPAMKETNEELKKRIISMLTYYALYYKLVSKESIYFSRSRVFLPFNYYQHGIGMQPFMPEEPFRGFFFDMADARKGYGFIRSACDKIKKERFPSGENFVIEYAMFFEKLAKAIE